ncbi:MAG: IclR family transcriptional regulator [Nitrososphaerota archaeon]|jgi:DNA-binding IclR family transcriptional regulator|nr:IclR family transcriptional regulator [Nitrososphaerota archaeon]
MTRLVPAVDRAFDVLELFLGEEEELSMPEIVALTGLPRTTVFEIVGTLLARNYLSRTADHKDRFELGFMSFQLGTAYRWRSRLIRVGQRIAEEVSAKCSETVNVAVLDGHDVVYLCTVEGNQAVRITVSVGRRLPAHCTALGKVLLANVNKEELGQLYPAGAQLVSRTQYTLTTSERLFRELDEVRASGYAIDRNESNEGVSCLAAPIMDDSDRVVAAMSVTIPSHRFTAEEESRLCSVVMQGALRVSARLGCRASQVKLTNENKSEIPTIENTGF